MSLTKRETRYTPQKVLSLAIELGVHESCVSADIDGACDKCIDIMNLAFDTHYGHAENANDALMMIISDIMEDRNKESR